MEDDLSRQLTSYIGHKKLAITACPAEMVCLSVLTEMPLAWLREGNNSSESTTESKFWAFLAIKKSKIWICLCDLMHKTALIICFFYCYMSYQLALAVQPVLAIKGKYCNLIFVAISIKTATMNYKCILHCISCV